MLRKALFILAAAGAAAASGAAAAQPAQTVESAQEFLRITLPGNRYMGGGIRTMVDNVSAEARTNVTISGLGTITQYQPAGRCKVLTSYDYSQVRLTARGESLPIPNPQHFIGATASFGDMTGVQVIGSVVYLSWKGNTHRSEIYLGSESLANRVGFAFEFLRMNCDPAAATGF